MQNSTCILENEFNMIKETKPLLVLHRIPTARELQFLRHYIRCYKEELPCASKQEIRKAAQIKFDSKFLNKPFKREDHSRGKIIQLNNKPVDKALTRPQ
jgi:hypothetical protein